VKDRFNEHKEFVFRFVPEPDYWFDLDAVREDHKESSKKRAQREFRGTKTTETDHLPGREMASRAHNFDNALHPNGKNPGDIFETATDSYEDAHFAVYPPELIEPWMLATCPPKVCADCGTPYDPTSEEVPAWERDPANVERRQLQIALEKFYESDLTEEHLIAARSKGFADAAAGKQQDLTGGNADETDELAQEAKDVLGGYFREMTMTATRPTGYEQACECETDETQSGVVLDPFAGAGTTCLVAKELDRRFLGVELNPEYVAMAQKRVGITVDEPERLLDDGATALSSYAEGGEVGD
jgi:hypothetical protein